MLIACIYLAAGKSSRMGTDKLCLPIGEQTLGNIALQTALKSSVREIYVISNGMNKIDWMSQAYVLLQETIEMGMNKN